MVFVKKIDDGTAVVAPVYERATRYSSVGLSIVRCDELPDNRNGIRELYDAELTKTVLTCIKTLNKNVDKAQDIKSIKELAGTMEVLTRTLYRVLDIPTPKDSNSDAGSDNIDKLVSMLEAEVEAKNE